MPSSKWPSASLQIVLALAAQPTITAGAAPASDIPMHFANPEIEADYFRREVMIPMRDGVKLMTVIVIPSSTREAPMLLTRTPYNASKQTQRSVFPGIKGILSVGDELLAEAGYIRVYQDVRGKHGSEGDYIATRPLRGSLNTSGVDHSTDAYDTIEWLSRHVPESNGNVGIIGASYGGFTALMALIDAHPALRAAVAVSPMVDGWKGDDWFHNGAFRQVNFDYFYRQMIDRKDGRQIPRDTYDDYEGFLRAGSAGDFARKFAIDQIPFFQKITSHPSYDAFWRAQALDSVLATRDSPTPTMHVGSLWDQEDIYGAIAAYTAQEQHDRANDRNFLVLGPWRHSGANHDGSTLGALRFEGDTALQFRRDILIPFLDQHLRNPTRKTQTPPVFAYETGSDAWRRYAQWPPPCNEQCETRLYLHPAMGLGFEPPALGRPGFDEYVADPAKPVPFAARPIRFGDAEAWRRWLVADQRVFADRPDVLAYVSEVLREPLQVSGASIVNLFASTSGTDSDWIVKLIDVYPEEVPRQPEMGGYQLAVAMDIFRGRYRQSLEYPRPIAANEALEYRFALPHANHVFLPGHRIVVQIQSSWFPLYDRNPQTFVDNIFFANVMDYRKATQRIYRRPGAASFLQLPVVPARPAPHATQRR